MAKLNATHDLNRKSWVDSANRPDADFPIQNLPFGIFRRSGEKARGGVAIGDQIVDLSGATALNLFTGRALEAARAASGEALNALMGLGNEYASALRQQLSDLLRAEGPEASRAKAAADRLLVPMASARMELPTRVGSFTDFLTSIHHTRRMSQTGELPPSFKSMPIAYHSRATSVRVSGDVVCRPNGQFKKPDGTIGFGPEPSQDFELELGAFVGPANALGSPISMRAAPEHIFGFCLLNDWSARGIQRWESVPLGPFLGKSLSTTISPWVITTEAMAPFRAAAHARDRGDEPLRHLTSPEDQAEGGLDIDLECALLTPKMAGANSAPQPIVQTSAQHTYWTFAQMLVHHASNGCNLQSGDVLGSGTISGPTDGSRACLAEINERGTAPISLPTGEKRVWLEDGDEVIFRGRASRSGRVSIGFGECRGRLDSAVSWPN